MKWCFTLFLFALIAFGQNDVSPAVTSKLQTVKIAFVGDIFLGNWAVDFLDSAGVDYPFAGCAEIFREVDLVVGNLESPITTHDEIYVEKQYTMKSPPGIEKGLSNANIRAVTLANNHILDFGWEGLKSTMELLDKAGIKYFGAGANRKEALKEATSTINGQTIALLGFSATFPEEFWATDSTPGTAFPYDEDVREVVSRCAGEYDILVTCFHWGAELMTKPKDYQIDLAHLCIDQGSDLVIGHHPHVVQSIEIYNGIPIFYSLGNFTFASYSESAKVGMIAVVEFKDGKTVDARAVPVDVYNEVRNFQPVPLDKNRSVDFFRELQTLSDSLNVGKEVVNKGGLLRINE